MHPSSRLRRYALRLTPAAAALLLAACSATVTVPEPHADDRPVFLVEHGRHTSLVLTRADDSMVRYVYGDWRWYALNDTGFLRAFPTLLWRTQGALGRQRLPSPPEAATIHQRSRVVIEAVHPLQAPAEKVDALLQRLDERFDAARDTLHHSALYDLDFVHDPRGYLFWSNSNHIIAEWLDALDIPVRGSPAIGNWRLDHPH